MSNDLGYKINNYNPLALPCIDLAEKFANEISVAGSVWKWIQARIKNRDISDINLGDYFKFTLPEVQGHTDVEFTARIHKIYYEVDGSLRVDFWCDELLPEPIRWNGEEGQETSTNLAVAINYSDYGYVTYPYLQSHIYYYLNGLRGYTIKNVSYNASSNIYSYNMMLDNYTATGLYNSLPSDMKNVLVSKKSLESRKYLNSYTNISSSMLSDAGELSFGTIRIDIGYLWIPTSKDINSVDNTVYEFTGYKISYASDVAIYLGYLCDDMYHLHSDAPTLSMLDPKFACLKSRNGEQTNSIKSVYWLRNTVSGSTYVAAQVAYDTVNYNPTSCTATKTVRPAAVQYSQTAIGTPLCFTIG